MNKLSSANIVILGCGLSGMITALKLAHLNIPSTIIEFTNTDSISTKDNRTTALSSTSKNFFAEIDLWRQFENFCCPIEHIYVVDDKSPTMLHFALPKRNDQFNEQAMGYLIQNHLFKKILLTAIKNNPLIKLIDQCEYQKVNSIPDSVILTLKGKHEETIAADLVIICDGKNSKAKNYYFSNDFNKYYYQHALTFNVDHTINHEGTAVEHFLPSGPFAILPLKGGYSSSIVWTVPENEAKRLLELNDHEFLYLVEQNFGSFLGTISMSGAVGNKINSFPLSAHHAEQYFYQRLVLVADSAHSIHPLAGQGLNQGIMDIASLSHNLLKHGISEAALMNYQQERKADNYAMYLITNNLDKIFSNDSRVLKNFRQLGFQMINNLPLIKNKLVKYAMGQR